MVTRAMTWAVTLINLVAIGLLLRSYQQPPMQDTSAHVYLYTLNERGTWDRLRSVDIAASCGSMKCRVLILRPEEFREIEELTQKAAIHPPNPNKLCQRPGCGHYRFSHDKGNGACLFVDPVTPVGHCEGFLR